MSQTVLHFPGRAWEMVNRNFGRAPDRAPFPRPGLGNGEQEFWSCPRSCSISQAGLGKSGTGILAMSQTVLHFPDRGWEMVNWRRVSGRESAGSHVHLICLEFI
jgi:hypothetical protein